jgi:hypothetical protein
MEEREYSNEDVISTSMLPVEHNNVFSIESISTIPIERDNKEVRKLFKEFKGLLAVVVDHCLNQHGKEAYAKVPRLREILYEIEVEVLEDLKVAGAKLYVSKCGKFSKAILFVTLGGITLELSQDASNQAVFNSLKTVECRMMNELFANAHQTIRAITILTGYSHKKISNFIAASTVTNLLANKIVERSQFFTPITRYDILARSCAMYINDLTPYVKLLEQAFNQEAESRRNKLKLKKQRHEKQCHESSGVTLADNLKRINLQQVILPKANVDREDTSRQTPNP